MLLCDKDRLQDKISTFSKFGDTGTGGISRLSLSAAAIQARNEFKKRCEKLNMEVVTDDLGDMYAVYPGTEKKATIMMGSHADSVINGGNYDGILGVLTALEVAETLITSGTKTKNNIGVMIWTNEEGARFPPALMCSGVVAGKFDKAQMMAVRDKGGVSFQEALDASGFKGEEKNRMSAKNQCAFFELHIEQGPVLEMEKKDIGVVVGVVGMVNYTISLKGVSDHAGTTPQHTRKDPLYAASQVIIELWDKLAKIDPELVFTTGIINAYPNIHTVIPNLVEFSLDARHKDAEVIKKVVEVIKALPKEVAKCKLEYKENWARNTIMFDKAMVASVQKAADELGYPSRKIYSGAGHDAQYVADMMPTTMIFVPSLDGHSHCVEEHTSTEACWKGANVMLQAFLEMDQKL